MKNDTKSVEEKLDALLTPKQWRRDVYKEFKRIPAGFLASYGSIADRVKKKTGNNPGARNVAWLRRRLYEILGHNTEFPLHRIAKAGDVGSSADSQKTRSENNKKRAAEGSLVNPQWM